MAHVDHARPEVSIFRSVRDVMSRPRLFTVLERQSSLTVLHAPRGFGKHTLIATWLQRGGGSARQVTWIQVDSAAVDPVQTWSDDVRILTESGTPQLVVVVGVPPDHAAAILRGIRVVLERCPSLIAIVAVDGTIDSAHASAVGTLDCQWINARQLCFTFEETKDMIEVRGVTLGEKHCQELHTAVAGVPPLISEAVSMLQIAPTTSGDLATDIVTRAVDEYVRRGLSQLDAAGETCVHDVAMLRNFTSDDAAGFTTDPGVYSVLAHLDTTGLILGTFDGVRRRWVWPDAVRAQILAHLRAHESDRFTQIFGRLTQEHLDAGRYDIAAAYAADGHDWDAAARIVADHWSYLVDQSFEMLVHLVRVIPDEYSDRYPGVAAGKALFVSTLDRHPMLDVDIPDDPEELAALGQHPDAAGIVTAGIVQTIALRTAGSLHEARDRSLSLLRLVESMNVHQPEQVTRQLPTIRLQWAIGMQLAGDLSSSTAQLEISYREGTAAGFDFVVLNSAGSIALNWALLGDLARAAEWRTAESVVDVTVEYWDEMIRVGGRVADTLLRLDRLDIDRADAALDLLGLPPAGEELWGFVAYARAQHALSTGRPYSGLTDMHRMIERHRSTHQPGAASDVLLTATDIDLNLALGNGNLARALAEADTTGHPLIVVATARMELLTGSPAEARAVLNRISWPSNGWFRAHLEALLIDAAASLHIDREEARRSWCRAVDLAESLGNTRAFTALPRSMREELCRLSGVPDPVASFPDVFPDSVSKIVLTPREQEILVHLDRGVARKDLAGTLFVSYNTIKAQLRSIYTKLDAHSVTEAVTRARELHLIPIPRH